MARSAKWAPAVVLGIVTLAFVVVCFGNVAQGGDGCQCGPTNTATETRGPCVCLFYEYCLYVPPPPSSPIYYYYGMACPVEGNPGTVVYSDAIRRTVGSCHCSSPSACPDPPSCSDGNCFKPNGRLIHLAHDVTPRPPYVIVPPGVTKKCYPKIPPQAPPILLSPHVPPGFSAKPEGDPWFAKLHFLKGKSAIVKLQKIRMVASAEGLPENIKGETTIGHGVEVVGKPEGQIVDIPRDKIHCPSSDSETSTSCVVLVEYEGTIYIVLLGEPVECTPTKAANL